MEDKLLKAIENTLGHLNKDEEQCKKALEEINSKIKSGESREEKEYKDDLEKIQEEIKDKQEDKERATDLFKLMEEKEDEKQKLDNAKNIMLKNREECEDAIKQVEGKKEYKDGKLVDSKELLEYRNDLDRINAELAKIENKIKQNSKETAELKNEISNLYKKYKVKEEKENKKDEAKKVDGTNKQTMPNEKSPEEQMEDLQKQLEESAKRMAEYNKNGFVEQEAEEHKTYNDLINKINKLKEPVDKEKDDFYPPAVVDRDKDDFQPPAVTDKDKFQPPAVTDKDKFQPPAEIEEDDIEIPEPGENLPIRSFWEIYNDTCTEHVGSIANIINRCAHMPTVTLFFSKNEDSVHKILNIIPTPFKMLLKGAAKIPNAIMGTDKKIEAMRENIEGLSQQDFEVLIQNPENVNQMFDRKVKDSFDRDYLDSQFMKQYKVNNAYLDVVKERLERERGTAVEYYNAQATLALNKLKELEEIGVDNLTPEQKQEYFLEKLAYDNCVNEGKKCAKEITDFEEGAKKKSSAHRNISGWFLAKFNPDNREENAKMAELSKERREMGERGDNLQVDSISVKMEKLTEENSDFVQIGSGKNKNNILDRAPFARKSPVEVINRGEQTKGRLLLTNIMGINALVGLYKQIQNILSNREILTRHNQDLSRVNSANKNIQVEGKVKISDSPDASKVEDTISKQTVEAGLNRAERGNLDGNNWNMGTAYHQADVQSHADAAQAAKDADSLMKQGKNLDALKSATKYYSQVQNGTRANISDYMSAHPEHDYSAFSFGDTADMSKVYEFFTNGTIDYQTNITATMAEMMGQLKEGVDLNGVIFATATSLYNAQREGTKDIRKRVRIDVEPQNTTNNNQRNNNRENNTEREQEDDEREE